MLLDAVLLPDSVYSFIGKRLYSRHTRFLETVVMPKIDLLVAPEGVI